MKKSQKIQAFVCIAVSTISILYLPRGIRTLIVFDHQALRFLFYNFFVLAFISIGVIYFVLRIEKRNLKSIGFVPFKPQRDIKWGLIGFGLGGMSFALTGPIVESMGLGSTIDGVQEMADVYPVWRRVGIAFVAGISEEIIFRSYPIERLKEWTGSLTVAAVISIMIFAGLHIPFWDLGGAIQIGVGTIIWTLIYIKTRSIWAMFIMHIVNDLFAFVALPLIFA